MDKWHGKVAVVTGASSGIGAAIASALVHHGMVVVGLARRDDIIKKLAVELADAGAPGKLHAFNADVRKEEDILAAFSWVEERLGGADILVNNAGIFLSHYLTEGKTEDWRAMLEVNVLAPAIFTREYLKSMEKRNKTSGHIVMISSVAGHLAESAHLHMYSATKHALKAMSMCLRRELAEKKSTIKVTSISPGPVSTELFHNSEFDAALKTMPTMKVEDVVDVVISALSASPVTQICDIVMTPMGCPIGRY